MDGIFLSTKCGSRDIKIGIFKLELLMTLDIG